MSIRAYLPKREKMVTLQVKMPESLLLQVKNEMQQDNYQTWREFLVDCFKSYLKEKNEDTEGKTKK
jgi:metal-responsive CopG/Arc/MetJ family transcriptional regulator